MYISQLRRLPLPMLAPVMVTCIPFYNFSTALITIINHLISPFSNVLLFFSFRLESLWKEGPHMSHPWSYSWCLEPCFASNKCWLVEQLFLGAGNTLNSLFLTGSSPSVHTESWLPSVSCAVELTSLDLARISRDKEMTMVLPTMMTPVIPGVS